MSLILRFLCFNFKLLKYSEYKRMLLITFYLIKQFNQKAVAVWFHTGEVFYNP